ncbi:MAG TPA: ABC transporter permease [Actinomycetota bacterium]|nr:ABC transporter permease [Actinomycetota bacterium]
MRAALVIAAKELRQRIRDRSVFVIAFIVPFALAGILSLTLSNTDESAFTATYGVVDLDHGDISAALQDLVGGLDFAEVRTVSTAARADQLTDDGDVDAAFVIPAGFSDAVMSARATQIQVITNPERSIEGLIARSLAQSYAADLNSMQVSIAVALGQHTGTPDPAAIARLQQAAHETAPTAQLQRDTAENRLFSSTTFFAVGMAVFFVFFTVEFGVRSLLTERETGTLARMLVAPMRPAWIIGGKVLAAFVVGLVSMTALVVASSLLLGADWGNPLGVALLLVAGVLAAMGLTALVASLARSPGQAAGYASVAAVVGGLLGGTFFPLSQGPSILATLSLIAPQAWLMRGFQDLASGGGLAEILPALVALATFTLVLGGIAIARAGKLAPR